MDSYCPICCNDNVTELITCASCNYSTCFECCGKYILNVYNEPTCMNCRKDWGREFVMEQFDRKWVNTYFLKHMGRLLMEQEKLLLPETQQEASYVSKIKSLSTKMLSLPTNARLRKKNSEDYLKALENKREERKALIEEINELKKLTVTYGNANTNKSQTNTSSQKIKYILKCPYDDCRGFISSDYICGTCERTICKSCHICLHSTSEKHKCKKDDIKSAASIINETKPCPKCMTPIWRSSGCAQMFCTQCHTAFDWNTLIIDNGIIHNPHYYEYLANTNHTNNINIENIACGDLPRLHMILQQIPHSTPVNWIQRRSVAGMYQRVMHLREIVLPLYETDRVKDNFDLRVKFLNQEFDEDTWIIKLINRDKKRMHNKAMKDLIQMLIIVIEDFIRQLYVDISKIDMILNQFSNQLTQYCKDSIERIQAIHGKSINDYQVHIRII